MRIQTGVQKKTLNYEMFKTNSLNRVSVGENHEPRKDLVKSMKADGFWAESPVRCYANEDGSLTIFDGHNRLLAAQSLGLPVEYVVYSKNGKGELDPIRFSTTATKQWSISEIAEGYKIKGSKDYVELADYVSEYGIPINCASSMLMGEQAGSANANKFIRNGTFKVKQVGIDHAVVVGYVCNEVSMHADWAKTTSFVIAVSRVLLTPGFKLSQLLDKINKYPELLKKQASWRDYIDMIDVLYNRNQKEKFAVRFESDEFAKKRSAVKRNVY
jgi:hypothetical protein